MGLERYGKDVAELAIEVRQIALWVSDRADHQIGDAHEALMEQAQRDALAATGVAMHHGEAAFAGHTVLNAPAEVIELGWHEHGLDGDVLGEGVELQTVQGQQVGLIHSLVGAGGR